MTTPQIERLLADDYLGDLTARPIEEIRAMRSECQRVEVGLSFLRRLVQGRLDIVAADLRQRREGTEPPDASALVDQLPGILGEHVHAPGMGRLPTLMAPDEDDVDPELQARLDSIVDAATLGSLPELSDAEITSVTDRLAELEHTVSTQRRLLFDRIDALQAELTRRYKSGDASVDSLLG